jgi:hypothetical protein
MRPVRVIYRRDPKGGWTYTVLAAEGALELIATGWSKGKRKDAVEAFRQHAARFQWEERDARRERMRGAA